MAGIHCFTSISFAYLDRARILAETVKRFHPTWTLWLGLSDEEPPGFDFNVADEAFDRVLRVKELGVPFLRQWIFGHDVVELCTAVKGAMLSYLLDYGAEKVIYLDPDIALFDSIEPVSSLLDRYAIVLTPHLTSPESTRSGIIDNEIGSLKHGAYNLGFIAVNSSDEGCRFARWWRDRLLDFCYDDIPSGLFTDQKWCDLVPGLFEGTHILRDPGYNVACWNLSNRSIEIRPNGSITAAGAPLRFFHFTKIEAGGEAVLEHNSHGRWEVFELVRWYRDRLAHHKADGLPLRWWAFGRYEDGLLIEDGARILYRTRSDLRERFPDPFASGPDTFQAFLGRAS